jgi:hypothetical protein
MNLDRAIRPTLGGEANEARAGGNRQKQGTPYWRALCASVRYLCRQLRSVVVIIVATVVAILIGSEADSLRVAAQLQDIQPGPVAVGRVDEPAIVDFEVVGLD